MTNHAILDPVALLAAVTAIGGIPASHRRLAYWLPRGEHRIVCAGGHTWAPRYRSRRGSTTITCDFDSGNPCRSILCEIVTDQYPRRLVAEVSKADLQWMADQRMAPDSEIAYLMNEGVRQ